MFSLLLSKWGFFYYRLLAILGYEGFFCVLSLAIFLNSFWVLSSILLRFLYGYIIISPTTRDGLTSLPIFVPLNHFSCLITLANTSFSISTILSSSRNNGHPYFILVSGGNVLIVLPLNKMLALGPKWTLYHPLLFS